MAKVPPMTPNFETNPISLVSEASRIIGNWKSSQDYLAETLTPATATFRNLIVPLQEGNNHAAHGLRPLTLLARVSPDPEVRDAARTAEAQMEAAETAALMRIDIAELVTVVFDGHSAPASSNSPGDDLDGEDRHLLTFVHGKYQRSGAGIRDPVTRDRLKSATDQLNELVTEAKKALTEESGGIWLMLTELDGVPEKILQGMKHRAGDGDAGEEVLVTLRKGHLMPAMRNARKENTRRKLYDANESRFPENAGRLTEILKLRHEIARLLGFENHAALKMKERMHDNVSDIQSLLQRTRQMLQSASRMEIYTMLQLKRETDPTTEGLFHWDWSFYAQKLKKQRYSFDTDTFSEYFELWHTLDGMLEIFQELFGVVFKIIGANVWHQDVVVYEAWNSGDDGFLGHLYVDLFSRNGKYDGASHFMIGPGFTEASGVEHFPVSALVYNFVKHPSAPTLLQHNEIRTLFHELGHGVHNLVSRTKYALPSSRDFVEVPSIMLENFVWVPEILERLSMHFSYLSDDGNRPLEGQPAQLSDPGTANKKKLPRALAQAVHRCKNVNAAHDMLTQIRLSMFDLAIHAPLDGKTVTEDETTVLWNMLRRDVVGLQQNNTRMTAGQAGFRHIYRGYDAGYFGYVTSRLYATDIFQTAFAADPMDANIGKRYRQAILEPGSSRPESEILKTFLGRMPNSEAFHRELEAGSGQQ